VRYDHFGVVDLLARWVESRPLMDAVVMFCADIATEDSDRINANNLVMVIFMG
jgi:tellurite resistance protein